MASAAEMFALALQFDRAGDVRQAEQICLQILQSEPGHAESYQLLGMLAHKVGRCEDAANYYQHALRLQPDSLAANNNLGAVRVQQGRWQDAEACYYKAIQLNPNFAEAHNGLGYVLQRQSRLEEAINSYRSSLRSKPDFAEAHYNLGNVLTERGNLDEAVDCYQRALYAKPNHAKSWNNLGNVLARQDKFDRAAESYMEAVRLSPNLADGHFNLGIVLKRQGHSDEAIDCFHAALRIDPNFAAAYCHLGHALRDQRRQLEAAQCYQQALRLKPDNAEAHNGLGAVMLDFGNWNDAALNFRNALRIDPVSVETLCNLGRALGELRQYREATRCYEQVLAWNADDARAHTDFGGLLWHMGRNEQARHHLQESLLLKPGDHLLQSNALLCLNYDPYADPEEIYTAHKRWGVTQIAAVCSKPHQNNADPERRLRIGYVSPDFRHHVLRRYFEPVLANHDKKNVEVFCYAEVASPDAVTASMQQLVNGWRWTCRVPDVQVAEMIRNDRIDILVDLAGHTGNNRLPVFAHKPAPVQATWLGYLNTTGLSTIDYRLTDEVLDPPDQPLRDTEELVRLPDGFCCFAPPEEAPSVAPLPALQRGHVTFGSTHNLFKLNAAVFDLWCKLLNAVPTSRLLIFRDTLASPVREDVHKQFVDRGIAPQRVELRRDWGEAGYLGIYGDIDVNLDAFPWTGGVTTCESLWMGVPVLTLAGVRPAARNSAAILTRAGLANWVAKTPEEFVALGVELTSDLKRLANLRDGLREKTRFSLCEAQPFTKTLEEAYRTLWRRWCSSRHIG